MKLRVPRVALAVAAVGLAALILALTFPLLLRAVAPQDAVDARFAEEFDAVMSDLRDGQQRARDPWGRPWQRRLRRVAELTPADVDRTMHVEVGPGEAVSFFSSGPDPVDAADDLVPGQSARAEGLSQAPLAATTIGALLLVWALALLVPRRSRLWRELALAALMAAPVVAIAAVAVGWIDATPLRRGLLPRVGEAVLVPSAVAVVLSVGGVALLAAFGLRRASPAGG